jgi:hypothetical protein
MRIHASACVPDGSDLNDRGGTNRMAKTIEEYAVALVAEGAESYAEDDTDENGELASTDDLRAAIRLACDIAHAIRDNPAAALALVDRSATADADQPDE